MRPTAGSDTAGGSFDPSIATGVTDYAATSATGNAPVISSATYNFVAGDVGDWVFIKSGTNWTPGWYQITSVAANVATVNATIGAAILYNPGNNGTLYNTVAGCATTASPTGGTGSVDYSQADSHTLSLTDLTFSGAVAGTSVTGGFTPVMVGNALYITGAGLTTGRYFLATYVNTGSITTDRTPGTGTGTTMKVGGALATLAETWSARGMIGSNVLWWKNTGTLGMTVATPTSPAGTMSAPTITIGYNALRGDLDSASVFTNHPLIQQTSGSGVNFLLIGASNILANIICDCNQIGSTGFSVTGSGPVVLINCKGMNAKNPAIYSVTAVVELIRCYVTGCSTVGTLGAVEVDGGGAAYYCVVAGNAIPGLRSTGTSFITVGCIFANNTGASSDGLSLTAATSVQLSNNICYANGRDGIRLGAAGMLASVICNNVLVSNGGYGLNFSGADLSGRFGYVVSNFKNFYYNNTSGNRNQAAAGRADVTLTGDPFTNGAGGDFSLNNTAGAGAAVRAAGFPGTFSGISTTGYLDGGAVQHQDSGGSGGVTAPSNVFGAEGVWVG